jgi:Protein of unknown function (DUF2911)
MFVIPDDDKWTLIISRSTDTSGKYDEHQDLMRVPMQWGELSSPENRFSIYFAQSASGQCTMRLDLGRIRTCVGFPAAVGDEPTTCRRSCRRRHRHPTQAHRTGTLVVWQPSGETSRLSAGFPERRFLHLGLTN